MSRLLSNRPRPFASARVSVILSAVWRALCARRSRRTPKPSPSPRQREPFSLDSFRRKLHPASYALALLLAATAFADTGTLTPNGKQAPDPAILSLDTMQVDITIDNGDAHIHLVQIFANHTAAMEEGTYRFALPTGATVSDFAVWDGPVRIPAVILERKRAEQIYAEAKAQAIDPGLLAAGEREGTDPTESAIFTAKIAPIPAFGTKRLELDYHQRLATSDLKQFLAFPLKPDAGQTQTVAHFSLHFSLRSAHPVTNLQAPNLKLTCAGEGTWNAENLNLTQDFTATWTLSADAAGKLEVITHRDDLHPLPTPGSKPEAAAPNPGFFAADLLLAPDSKAPATAPRTVLLLFDTSLSMQFDKLERSYAALEATLHALTPADHFNVLLFNSTVTPFKPAPIPADPAAVAQALTFVRASRLRGGTNLLQALKAGLAQSTDNTTLALFTDGGTDEGETVVPGKVAARYLTAWQATPHPPHTAVFAIGDDAETPFLRSLAHAGGFLEQVLSTEPLDFHLQSWLSKLTHDPVPNLTLAAPAATSLVYSLNDAVYPGSIAQWVGQYQPAATPQPFTAHGASATVPLPALNPDHPQLPRLWAQARVDALLAQIDRDGETTAAIDEIIRLSRRYKFVTPYTSFLAVPRALLRPRVIRPGDPVLRVRTDPAITSVIALFPFGLTKPLRHLASEDLHAPKIGASDNANRLWETRFLAPTDMKDGTYSVRLLLRDTAGNTYNESKTFVIASTTPTVKLALSSTTLHPGQTLEIKAAASQSTRTLTAHMEGLNPTTLRWNPAARTNTGALVLPAGFPLGRYTLTVTAEDIAHNIGTQEVQIDVLP